MKVFIGKQASSFWLWLMSSFAQRQQHNYFVFYFCIVTTNLFLFFVWYQIEILLIFQEPVFLLSTQLFQILKTLLTRPLLPAPPQVLQC